MRLKAAATWVALCVLLCAVTARAENIPEEQAWRGVESVWALQWGANSVLDTYLSPLRYHGWETGLSASWRKNFTRRPDRWAMLNDAGVYGGRTLSPARNSAMYDLTASYDWGAERRWTLPFGLTLAAGASAGAEGGVIYLPRNGNNPASAKAEARLSVLAGAEWGFTLGRMPVRLREQLRLPSLSVFFSPQYGETYYEIYLGNRNGLAHCGWWGNHFALDNLVSADLGLGRTALRIGYRFEARTSWVCSINTQRFTNSLVIGVIPGGLRPRKTVNRKPADYGTY